MGTRIGVALVMFAVVGAPTLPSAGSLVAASSQATAPQQHFFVVGKVAKPGAYSLTPDAKTTVEAAIKAAGGLTLAATDVSMVIRRRDADGEAKETVVKSSDEIVARDVLSIQKK